MAVRRKDYLLLILIGLFVESALASNIRHSHITWRPTGVAGEVVFTVSSSFRRAAPDTRFSQYLGNATDGGLAVGDTFSETIDATRLSSEKFTILIIHTSFNPSFS